MNKIVNLLCCSLLLFTPSFVKSEGETEFMCKPTDIYLQWSSVRSFLVHVAQMKLPGSWEGHKLKYSRCFDAFSNCPVIGHYCGVSAQNATIKKITLTKNNLTIGHINLDVLEDIECSCLSEETYHLRTNSITSIPPIYEAFLETR